MAKCELLPLAVPTMRYTRGSTFQTAQVGTRIIHNAAGGLNKSSDVKEKNIIPVTSQALSKTQVKLLKNKSDLKTKRVERVRATATLLTNTVLPSDRA